MADSITQPASQFKPRLRKSTRRPAQTQRLRVRAESDHGLLSFCIEDYESRRPVAAEFGALPDDLLFDKPKAELYALANAARWIEGNLPGAVVAMVCTQPARDVRGKARAAA